MMTQNNCTRVSAPATNSSSSIPIVDNTTVNDELFLMIIRMKNGNDRYHFGPKMSMSPTSSLIISMCDALCHELMLSYVSLNNQSV